ncbi:MAG: hypothetical protein V1760_03775 [Candidatus Peregrinibacteria bacterium]
MKKIFIFALSLVTLLALNACTENRFPMEDEDETEPVAEEMTEEGLVDETATDGEEADAEVVGEEEGVAGEEEVTEDTAAEVDGSEPAENEPVVEDLDEDLGAEEVPAEVQEGLPVTDEESEEDATLEEGTTGETPSESGTEPETTPDEEV